MHGFSRHAGMHSHRHLLDTETGPVQSQEHVGVRVVAGKHFGGKIPDDPAIEGLEPRSGISDGSPDENGEQNRFRHLRQGQEPAI
jgi:hypothetical protein